MTVTIQDLTKAARALEYHGEDAHAENVARYVAKKSRRGRRIYSLSKSVLGYSILFLGGLITVLGAANLALMGQYFNAVGLLFVGVILFGFLKLVASFAETLIEWQKDEIGALEVENP